MASLFVADFFFTVGLVLGIKIYMKRTGESFQEVCLKIIDAIMRK